MHAHATIGWVVVAALLWGGSSPVTAEPAALTPQDQTTRAQLDAALAGQQAALDEHLSRLIVATESALKQQLQERIAALQADIQELTRLKEALLARPAAEIQSDEAHQAETVERQIDRQRRREERLLDERAAKAFTPR